VWESLFSTLKPIRVHTHTHPQGQFLSFLKCINMANVIFNLLHYSLSLYTDKTQGNIGFTKKETEVKFLRLSHFNLNQMILLEASCLHHEASFGSVRLFQQRNSSCSCILEQLSIRGRCLIPVLMRENRRSSLLMYLYSFFFFH
jgi:hypothetical protein